MSTAPSHPTPSWAGDVAEPFRSDGLFWRSVTASADALAALLLATVAAVIARLTATSALLGLAPFALPLVLLVRAGSAGLASSRASRRKFNGAEDALTAWRLAERTAVASVFRRALLRNRLPRR